jgi:hypothetical protein
MARPEGVMALSRLPVETRPMESVGTVPMGLTQLPRWSRPQSSRLWKIEIGSSAMHHV